MTLVSVTAYHSFGGEVEALNTPTIRRLTPSCRHQLPPIAHKKARINDVPTVEVTVEYLKALRNEVGRDIDPDTAEVDWVYAQVLDPYGDGRDLPEEFQQVGRDYFARSPGSNLWIWF